MGVDSDSGYAGFDILFYKSPQPMWIYDVGDLHILEANNAALLQYGYELSKELSQGHLRYNKIQDLELIMRRRDRDDCLFTDSAKNVYVVHLTWTAGKEIDPIYPRTRSYESLNKWAIDSLIADQNELYNYNPKPYLNY